MFLSSKSFTPTNSPAFPAGADGFTAATGSTPIIRGSGDSASAAVAKQTADRSTAIQLEQRINRVGDATETSQLRIPSFHQIQYKKPTKKAGFLNRG